MLLSSIRSSSSPIAASSARWQSPAPAVPQLHDEASDRGELHPRRARPPGPELERLSNILKSFNDQFGQIPWTDADRVHRRIIEEIPSRVAADAAYQNARANSDKQNARIEHDKTLARVMTAMLQDETELFKQFMDNESFRRWVKDTVFNLEPIRKGV